MRILFTTTYYLPYISGLTVYISRLGEELVKRGYKITILTSRHERDLPEKEILNGILVKRVRYLFKISKGFFMPEYFVKVIGEVRKSEIILINLPQFEAFIPALIGKLFRKRIYCVYNCEVYLPKGLFNFAVEKLLLWATFPVLVMADRIVAYTKDYADHSRLLPKFTSKTSFIYPPVPKPEVDKDYKKKLEKLLPGSSYVIGVAARLAAEKGLEYLLEAIPLLEEKLKKRFVIFLAGPEPVGEERYFKQIDLLAKKYADYLVFAGSIPPEKMGSFYNLLDILVLPSINSTEAFGMVQVEAMFRGVPVVASNLPGVRVPVLETGLGEIAIPKNCPDLAEKITRVLLGKKRYLKNTDMVEKVFSFDQTISFYLDLFCCFNDVSIGERFKEWHVP